MKKVIILLLISFVLVGCNAEYTLTINKDDSSDENVLIDNFSSYYDSVSVGEVVENTIVSDNYSYDINENELNILRHFDKYINLHDNSEISDYYTWEYGINDCKKIAYIEIGEGIISTWSIIFILILVTITTVLIIKKKKMRG